MPLHPLAEHFAAVADVYERGRPDYAPAVVEALAGELGLGRGDRLLDLAAGTGKLTRALIAGGLEVEAVEPQESLRAVLTGLVGAERVHDGLAEAIPFPDGTFAAITVADAFHWFDQQPALAEMGRVLRPGGGLALISMIPELPHAAGQAISDARTPHPFFDGTPWTETLAATPGWAAPRQVTVTARQRLPLHDYVRSMSWVAGAEPAARDALLAQVPDEAPELAIHAILTLSARA
jgi:SAM-dependent methyltransferase